MTKYLQYSDFEHAFLGINSEIIENPEYRSTSRLGDMLEIQSLTYEVANPEVYGILEVDTQGKPISIVEKPVNSKSNLAVTGLYVFDSNVVQISREVQPSQRGELEITSVIESYLKRNELSVTTLSRGTAWLDTGNPKAMHDAASYVRIIEERTGLKIGCPEEIGFRNGWIDLETLSKRAKSLCSSTYGSYLSSIC